VVLNPVCLWQDGRNVLQHYRNPVHVHELHATILHQLGINHEKLAFQYQGLDQRLTGVEPAKVVTDILA